MKKTLSIALLAGVLFASSCNSNKAAEEAAAAAAKATADLSLIHIYKQFIDRECSKHKTCAPKCKKPHHMVEAFFLIVFI